MSHAAGQAVGVLWLVHVLVPVRSLFNVPAQTHDLTMLLIIPTVLPGSSPQRSERIKRVTSERAVGSDRSDPAA